MGGFISKFSGISSLFQHIHISGGTLEYPPINYSRADDYAIDGKLREQFGALERWDQALQDYITQELKTRRSFYPIINKRMNRIEARLKYTSSKMEDLLSEFLGWNEDRLLEIHDLFQIFEIDGDGLIDIPEMIFALDSIGDSSTQSERYQVFIRIDEDATGSIDFEEFLFMLYLHEFDPCLKSTNLATSLDQVNRDICFIRSMSVCQQILSGFL